MNASLAPHLRSIRLEAIADGVYAAISVPGEGSLGNAGIVDLGDETLIFDTLKTPAAAEELRHAAEELTGRPTTWVVNSHWHDDHVAGNQVFQASARAFIATKRTRELMATQLVAEYAQDAEELPAFVDSLQRRLAAETDERLREQLALRLAETRLLAQAIPDITVILPTLTCDTSLTLHGTRRNVEMFSYGGGHTESDLVLYLPTEQIAFPGDLAFLGCHPWLPDGDPDEWTRILARLEQLSPRVVVPGHGPVSDTTCLQLTRRYIEETQLAAQRLLASSVSWEADISAVAVPAAFDEWEWAHFFPKNLDFLARRAAAVTVRQTAGQ